MVDPSALPKFAKEWVIAILLGIISFGTLYVIRNESVQAQHTEELQELRKEMDAVKLEQRTNSDFRIQMGEHLRGLEDGQHQIMQELEQHEQETRHLLKGGQDGHH